MGRPLFSKWNIAGVVQYLQENQLVGYGNVIAKPTQRLISGNYLGDYESSNIGGRTSVLKKRTLYLKDMIVYTWQLLYGLVVDSFILEYIPNLFKKVVLGKKIEKRPYWEEETEDEFEKKVKDPAILRKYVTRRVSRKKKTWLISTPLRKMRFPSRTLRYYYQPTTFPKWIILVITMRL